MAEEDDKKTKDDGRFTYKEGDLMVMGPDGKPISLEEFKKLNNIQTEDEEPAPVTMHIHPPEEDA